MQVDSLVPFKYFIAAPPGSGASVESMLLQDPVLPYLVFVVGSSGVTLLNFHRLRHMAEWLRDAEAQAAPVQLGGKQTGSAFSRREASTIGSDDAGASVEWEPFVRAGEYVCFVVHCRADPLQLVECGTNRCGNSRTHGSGAPLLVATFADFSASLGVD